MIDSHFRSSYQKLVVNPLLKLPLWKFLSPSVITLFAFLSGISIIPLLAYKHSFLAFSLLALSGLFDTLDGSLARQRKSSSPHGALFDLFSDRCVEFSVILGLYLFDPTQRGLLCILMLGSVLLCVTTFLTVGIFSENATEKSFHYSPGLMERAEAFLFFSAMILLPSFFSSLAITFTILVLLTAGMRLREFAKNALP